MTASTSLRSECPRDPVSLGLESRILKPNFASTYVTISRRASSKSSQAIRVEYQMLLFLAARHVGFPGFDPRLKFQKRAPRPREMIVRRRFRFLVGSYRFCLRHASNGFFRDLATMSFALQLVRAMSAVCICCTTNSRFCTPRSALVSVGRTQDR